MSNLKKLGKIQSGTPDVWWVKFLIGWFIATWILFGCLLTK